MAAKAWLDPEDERRRELRRWVGYSALGHAVALAALLWAPSPRTPAALPGVVTVDLVAMSAAPAAARPGRAPAPAPAPKPAPPKPAPAAEVPRPLPAAPKPPAPQPEPPKPVPPPVREAALPKPPERRPEPRPKEKASADPKPEPKPPPAPEPAPKPAAVAAKPAPKPEPTRAPARPPAAKPPPRQEDYDDLLAQLRTERGEARPARVDRAAAWRAAAEAAATAGTAGAGAAAAASGPGVPVPPEVASWLRAARIAVSQAWVVPAGFRREPLETQVLVELDARGNVLSEPRVVQRSGNPWYDESVVRAIRKASPLPPPPEAGAWPFVFRPEDLG